MIDDDFMLVAWFMYMRLSVANDNIDVPMSEQRQSYDAVMRELYD